MVRRKWRRGLIVAATVAMGLVAAGTASAAPDYQGETQAALDRIVTKEKLPGATVYASGPNGETFLHAGKARNGEEGPIEPTDHVRIGSITKTFTATTLLQLVGEGLVDLDAPVEKYLPGLVHGTGIDGNDITIRQLAQHTSRISNYKIIQNPVTGNRAYAPEELVKSAMSAGPTEEPGFSYANTNFVILGLVIEKVTGGTLADQIQDRILTPNGLTETSFPAAGNTEMPEPHADGYTSVVPGIFNIITTESEPSVFWGAGAMISTAKDTAKFYSLLAQGALLAPTQQEQMRTFIDGTPPDEYGLGLMRQDLPCGGFAYGHSGRVLGYTTWSLATDDGRQAFVAVNGAAATQQYTEEIRTAVENALCGA